MINGLRPVNRRTLMIRLRPRLFTVLGSAVIAAATPLRAFSQGGAATGATPPPAAQARLNKPAR